MQKNREAQEESLKRREQLIQGLEQERETRRWEKEQEEGRRTARMQEINTQVSAFVFIRLCFSPPQSLLRKTKNVHLRHEVIH